MIPRRAINPVSGRYGKILNFEEVSKIRYRYKIQILLVLAAAETEVGTDHDLSYQDYFREAVIVI